MPLQTMQPMISFLSPQKLNCAFLVAKGRVSTISLGQRPVLSLIAVFVATNYAEKRYNLMSERLDSEKENRIRFWQVATPSRRSVYCSEANSRTCFVSLYRWRGWYATPTPTLRPRIA